MPSQLLPASAKAFAVRTKPNVVLNTRAETWLTQNLKRINRQKRPLNSVAQHKACLEDILSGEEAIWSLASIMLPRAPKSELRQDENKLVEALFNYQLLQLEGYCVHIDMVSQHEVAFKLTQDTIDALVEYHRDIFSKDTAAEYTYDWPEKERQLKKLQDDFVQAVNRYVFRTHVRALEGIEEEGAGELLEGRSLDVRQAIEGLFQPLLPPPPKIIDVIAPGVMAGQWWSPHYIVTSSHAAPSTSSLPSQLAYHHRYNYQQPQPQQSQLLLQPVEPWRVLGSTPSPTTTQSTPWSYTENHMPSPTPSLSLPYSATSTQYLATPSMSASLPAQPYQALPLPSQLVGQQCGSAASGYSNMTNAGYWGYNEIMTQFPISI